MTTPQPGGTVLIGGASGLIGSGLVHALRERGTLVRRLVRRSPAAADEVRWDPPAGRLPDAAFEDVTSVVVLSGAGVADHRWTESYRRTLVESRIGPVSLLASRMAALNVEANLVAASAVGYYGDRGDTVLTEDAGPGTGFLADLAVAWEGAPDPARAAGLAVAHARTGLVMDPAGGALRKLLPLIRLGVAGPLGSGDQWWPWITLEDELRALLHLIDTRADGPFNLSAPEPERNRDLIRAFASALHRPAVIPVPAWALRLALGGFGGDLVASQRAMPTALLRTGFEFVSPTVSDATIHLFG